MNVTAALDPKRSIVGPERYAAASGIRLKGSDQAARPTRVDRDRQLVEALRRGEPAATEHLVATYGDRAYRLASGIAGSAQDAEEVVQDAFWTVVRKIDTFRGESAFGSWFYRIVANAAYQKLRRRPGRRSEISLDEVLPVFHESGQHAEPIADWSTSVDDPSRQTELRTALTAAIDELPSDYRLVLILHDVEGLSNLEVAETLGLGVANVKTRVHRARLFLRKRLADLHGDLGRDDRRSVSAVNVPARSRMTDAQRLGEGDAARGAIDAR
jgi:RNA polymerase sigma-70 factor (ECF subfamily)